MPWTSAFFTSLPARKATSARMSEALITPWPPRPATTTFTTFAPLDILALRAGGALGGPLLLGRLLVLADGGGGEDARPPRDDHRELRPAEPVDEQPLEALRVGHRIV